MTNDPADRLVDSGPRLPGAVGAAAEVAEADVIEQALPVDGDGRADIYDEPVPPEANPDDVAEQRLEVPIEDDDYPAG